MIQGSKHPMADQEGNRAVNIHLGSMLVYCLVAEACFQDKLKTAFNNPSVLKQAHHCIDISQTLFVREYLISFTTSTSVDLISLHRDSTIPKVYCASNLARSQGFNDYTTARYPRTLAAQNGIGFPMLSHSVLWLHTMVQQNCK